MKRPQFIIEIYRGINQKFYWRMLSTSNKKEVSDGSQGYTRKENCMHFPKQLVKAAPGKFVIKDSTKKK